MQWGVGEGWTASRKVEVGIGVKNNQNLKYFSKVNS